MRRGIRERFLPYGCTGAGGCGADCRCSEEKDQGQNYLLDLPPRHFSQPMLVAEEAATGGTDGKKGAVGGAGRGRGGCRGDQCESFVLLH